MGRFSEITFQENRPITGTVNSDAFDIRNNPTWAARAAWAAPASAKTFDSKAKASLVVQDITYTAAAFGTAGNSITIGYVAGGTAGSEVVTVVGTAISVSIDDTAVTGSSATQVLAAVGASAPALALITAAITGTGATVQAAASATPLAGGVTSELNLTANTASVPTHGFYTGTKGQLTTTGGTPTGLSTGTDYYLIVVDANTLKFAASYADALAGTAIDITGEGTGVHTFTATATLTGTVKVQASLDNSNWDDLSGQSQAISGAGSVLFVNASADAGYGFIRLNWAMSTAQGVMNAKGTSK